VNNRIAITGVGIVSSIGMNKEENLESLKANKHSISRVSLIDTKLKNSVFVGEIKKSNEQLAEILGLSPEHNFSRTSMLGALAAKEAINDAGIKPENDEMCGFINATSVGGMDMTEKIFNEFISENTFSQFIELQNSGVNTQNIIKHLSIDGYSCTISTACSSAANAIILGARMIKSGRLERVIVGGMDALCKFTLNGFNTLMILSDELNSPFDNNRKGLNLGEGAAYLVMESEESCIQRNKTPLGYLAGYSNTNDAFHQTASSEYGEGAYLAMTKALNNANLNPNQIDYINVHGTATPNNDLSEGRALLKVFDNNVPLFSSTKPFTGHTLAAAASIEAVFCLFSLSENCIFPNLNFSNKMSEFDLTPVTEQKSIEINTLLSNSFGFGGNCSSLIFTKKKD